MGDLPSGYVTFLLTDIEVSTALWERDLEAMRHAVASHRPPGAPRPTVDGEGEAGHHGAR